MPKISFRIVPASRESISHVQTGAAREPNLICARLRPQVVGECQLRCALRCRRRRAAGDLPRRSDGDAPPGHPGTALRSGRTALRDRLIPAGHGFAAVLKIRCRVPTDWRVGRRGTGSERSRMGGYRVFIASRRRRWRAHCVLLSVYSVLARWFGTAARVTSSSRSNISTAMTSMFPSSHHIRCPSTSAQIGCCAG